MSNWTPEMVATLQKAAPLSLEKAKDMAGDLGVPYRSIIAKCSSLGIAYERVAKGSKRGVKKADLADAIEDATGLELPSLGNLTARDLGALLAYVAPRDADAS